MSVTRSDDPAAQVAARAQERGATVGVVGAVEQRAELLSAIGTALRFPDYYGHNLDALDECLADLSWLPEGEVELVWTRDDVLAWSDPDAHRAVLAVLTDAVDASAAGPRPLRVVLAAG